MIPKLILHNRSHASEYNSWLGVLKNVYIWVSGFSYANIHYHTDLIPLLPFSAYSKLTEVFQPLSLTLYVWMVKVLFKIQK